MKRPDGATLDWPLIALILVFLLLVLFFTMDLWMPNPFPHV